MKKNYVKPSTFNMIRYAQKNEREELKINSQHTNKKERMKEDDKKGKKHH